MGKTEENIVLTVANDAFKASLKEGHSLLKRRDGVVATALGRSNGCCNQESEGHQLEHRRREWKMSY